MKKKIHAMIIVLTLIISGTFVAYYIFHQRTVPFEFMGTMAVPGNTVSPLTFFYTQSQDKLKYWVYNYRIEINQPVIEKPDLSLFDFERYDYLIYFGKKLLNLYYSPWLTYSEDECHYLKETPLFSILEEASLDTIYIYRIKKTSQFRAPCP